MGYHLRKIKKGKFGEFSKIQEEFEELLDAVEQKSPVMMLCELADIIGAIEEFTLQKYNIKLHDLLLMKDATKRAFLDGSRKSK